MRYEFDLARSFMKSSRRRGYHPHIRLSILGIAVGVAFLIFALSIYDGYVHKIETIIFSFYPQVTLQSDGSRGEGKGNFSDDLIMVDDPEIAECDKVCKGDAILGDQSSDGNRNGNQLKFRIAEFEGLKKTLSGVKGIKRVSPIIFEEANFSVVCSSNGRVVSDEGPIRILGVQGERGHFVPEIERTIRDRSLEKVLGHMDPPRAIISDELFRKFFPGSVPGSLNGDDVSKRMMLTIKGDMSSPGRRVELIVAGVFKLGMHKICENMILTSLDTAQCLLGMRGEATFVGLSLEDPYGAKGVSDQIKSLTSRDRYLVYDWMIIASDMFNSLSYYRKIVMVILFMSILITGFNIYTTLNIMILERKKQIGILISMGIKNGSLYRIFLIISQIEAIIGTVMGVAAGIILGNFFSDYLNRSLEAFLNIQDAGIVFHWGTVFFIFCFVCLLCGLTALWATRKGVGLDPVEALRSE